MVESKDKGIELMKPTFFEKDDQKNPKYVNKNVRIEKTYDYPKTKKIGSLPYKRKRF